MTTNHTWTRPEEIMDIIYRNRIHADVTRSKHTRSSWEETTHWCHEIRITHGIHSQPCGASEGKRQVATKECYVNYSVWFLLVRVQMGCTQSSKASEGQWAAGNKEVLCSLFCVAFPRSCTDGRLAAFKSIWRTKGSKQCMLWCMGVSTENYDKWVSIIVSFMSPFLALQGLAC